MSRIEIGGASYAVQVDGEGPPLLLIHGFTGRGSDWAPVVPALCRAATTIAVDLLGHGDSDSPADPARFTSRSSRRRSGFPPSAWRRESGTPNFLCWTRTARAGDFFG